LDDAYRQLSKGGNVLIEIDLAELNSILTKLEKTGFVGIEVPYYQLESKFITISGFKGKHGPCYDTGLSAAYEGSALAAFDDDNHLLTRGKESPVCEKTGIIYKFPPYRGLINIIERPGERVRNMDPIPEKFNLYSLDDELNALYSSLKDRKKGKKRITAFYPGPFRILILEDGTIIKRGAVNSVPEFDIKNLIRTDRLIKLKTGSDVKPVFFQDEYERLGPRCLQEGQKVVGQGAEVHELDLSQIDFDSMKLAPRLKGLIGEDRKYFILTGSDPADEMGCCPSDEVGEANRLVAAGVLSSISQEACGDTCPVSYYAFRDEIFVEEDDISFRKNEKLRREVDHRLKRPGRQVYRSVVKWILLAFVGLSLVFALLKIMDNSRSDKHHSLYEQLSVVGEDAIVVLLFHNRVRCEMCLNMEKHISTLLKVEYAELIRDNRIQFFLMEMNTAENNNHTDRFDLYTASVVIIKMENKEEEEIIILDDIWKDHKDETVFIERIREALEKLLAK
jgi:hypothetical protein